MYMYKSNPIPKLESQTRPLYSLEDNFGVNVNLVDSEEFKQEAANTWPEKEEEGMERAARNIEIARE